MKKLLAALLCCLVLIFAACGQEAAPTQSPTTNQTPTTEATVPATTVPQETTPVSTAVYSGGLACVSMPVITEVEKAANGTTLSYYAYPDVTVTLPDAEVAKVVNLDLLNKIDTAAKAAEKIHAAAKTSYSGQSDWYNYFLDVSYGVERFDQNVLSLYGTEAVFDGSPSSATIGVSANYDLSTGTRLDLKTIMFADFSADVLCQLIVDGLGEYEEGSLFPDYKDIVDQMFATNVPVDSWYFDREGLCFYFAPYEIAPNSMGIITSKVPYTALSGLMKEAYFPTEEFVYSGTVELAPVSEASLEQYSQFGELILGEGGQKYLLSAKGSVLNLQICELGKDAAQNRIPGKMLYACAGMGPADAVIIDLPADVTGLYFIFESNGQTVELPMADIASK